MTTAAIDARVTSGAAMLDAVRPGWVDRIDLDNLDLTSGRRCILGQVDRLYSAALMSPWFAAATGLDPDADYLARGWAAADRGLYVYATLAVGPGAVIAEYEALTEAWRALILRRREAAGA